MEWIYSGDDLKPIPNHLILHSQILSHHSPRKIQKADVPLPFVPLSFEDVALPCSYFIQCHMIFLLVIIPSYDEDDADQEL